MKIFTTLLRNTCYPASSRQPDNFTKNRKRFARTSARVLFFVTLTAASPIESRPNAIAVTPTLGNYPDTSLPLSTDTTVTPDAAPTNTTSINVSTSTNFKGKLEGNPTTGVVRVTDAHPAGTYTVTVRAFDTGGLSATKTFTLTVTTPVTCNPLTFAAATNFGTAAQPVAVAVGDFNGDGKQDLATANFAANVSILLGNGAGSFSAATNFGVGARLTPSRWAISMAMANKTSSRPTRTPTTSRSCWAMARAVFGAATNFGIGVGNYPDSVAVGDFNGDGRQDLAVAIYFGGVSILLGDGTGSFSPPTYFGVGSGLVSSRGGRFQWRWQARPRHRQRDRRRPVHPVRRWHRQFRRPQQFSCWRLPSLRRGGRFQWRWQARSRRGRPRHP